MFPFKLRIEESATRKQARIDGGLDVIVGVNKYRLEKEDPIEVRVIDNEKVVENQCKRLQQVRASRNSQAVNDALEAITKCAKTGEGCV